MKTPDEDALRGDEQARERSAEVREITAPTPADVRAKAEDPQDGDDEEPEPPAADVQAP
ncbi:hypothetical protein BX285_6527 [Streptomyces sp. 1114.5]|uniref:hypothetical protein n=1 Tax=Streptomyces sp. 1114.5 TaxID=1938830 RepID=UPI000F1F59F3|nr:hypothetical protein [Streptomyces sp. 1114.5]RKT09432.1 hypothetical protein BX285_6527 [Streptomyces sp. 1114.5]